MVTCHLIALSAALLHGAGDVGHCIGAPVHVVKGRGQHLRALSTWAPAENSTRTHIFARPLLAPLNES